MMQYLLSLLRATLNHISRIDSEARSRVWLKVQVRQNRDLRTKLLRAETDASDARRQRDELDHQLARRDAEIEILRQNVEHLAMVCERDRERVKAELATAVAQGVAATQPKK